MNFTYRKNDNASLFESVQRNELLDIKEPQNYVPLYKKFFDLNDKNYDKINLNNKKYLRRIITMTDDNSCKGIIMNSKNNEENAEIFFKYSPLLDPTKYLIGKYDENVNLMNLPKYNHSDCHAKVKDPNNAAYVDSFFTYLTSQLLHNHGIIHGIDFYGSFLGKKNNFKINIADDVEYLNDSDFFHKNRGTLFNIDNSFADNFFNFDTRSNKNRIITHTENLSDDFLNLGDINDISHLDSIFSDMKISDDIVEEKKVDLVFSYDISKSKPDSNVAISLDSATNGDLEEEVDQENEEKNKESGSESDCSSRSSDTDNERDSDSDDDDDDSTSYSTASEDTLIATINTFPVQVIALEKCYETMDTLIVDKADSLTDKEWGSMITQIIMQLIIYQKIFDFTHNDLHTNNVMYITTPKQYIYYKYNNRHYKIPTFGRIFKIIDFGRAIYKFRGNVICSDSYHQKGDAATQYNFEPYFNPDKPRLEPNYSFDLCRLACSLFDFIIDDIKENPKSPENAMKRLIIEWCNDDKNRNILYKNNGEERYPDFKLYKMISRTVHNHTPEKVIQQSYFNRYVLGKKKISKNAKIINIDSLPQYT